MKNKTWTTQPVSDSLALYEVLKTVLPKKGTGIIGIEYLGRENVKRKHNLLIGANIPAFARKNGFMDKSQAEIDEWNSIDHREGYFVFNANGSVGIEGILMNRNQQYEVAATTFMLKWVTSLSYKGVTYEVQNVPKRSNYGRITQVNNGYSKIEMPSREKLIVKCNFGQKGDKVSYCPTRKTYKNIANGNILEDKYFVKKGSVEYIAAKKELNKVTDSFDATRDYWNLINRAKQSAGKSVINS